MSNENEAMVLRLFDAISNGDKETMRQVLASNCVGYENGELIISTGPEAYWEYNEKVRAGLPDLHVTVEDIFSTDDRVAVRVTVRGTHLGEVDGIPPTSKEVELNGIVLYRLAGAKITEEWTCVDNLAFMQQIGAVAA